MKLKFGKPIHNDEQTIKMDKKTYRWLIIGLSIMAIGMLLQLIGFIIGAINAVNN